MKFTYQTSVDSMSKQRAVRAAFQAALDASSIDEVEGFSVESFSLARLDADRYVEETMVKFWYDAGGDEGSVEQREVPVVVQAVDSTTKTAPVGKHADANAWQAAVPDVEEANTLTYNAPDGVKWKLRANAFDEEMQAGTGPF